MLPSCRNRRSPRGRRSPGRRAAVEGTMAPGAWRGFDVDLPGEPEERLEKHGADGFAGEAFGEVSEGAVKDAALAVIADPGEREIAICAVDARGGEVDSAGVQREEHAHAIAREVAELVELLGEAERGRGETDHRAVRVLDLDGGFLCPGMAVEVAADEVAVFGPHVVAVGGAVRAAEALALADEVQQ